MEYCPQSSLILVPTSKDRKSSVVISFLLNKPPFNQKVKLVLNRPGLNASNKDWSLKEGSVDQCLCIGGHALTRCMVRYSTPRAYTSTTLSTDNSTSSILSSFQ